MSKSKKVAIITRHDVPNYGSFLQTLAMQRVLEELSYDPTIIDYKRDDDNTDALIKQYCEDSRGIQYKIYYHTLWKYSHSQIVQVMKKERTKYLKCSLPITKEKIKTLENKYDYFLTGSDQVWNTVGSGSSREIDGAFFWDGIKKGANVLSYAASFGDSKLSNEDINKCKNWLRKYRSISVREDTGVELLRQMGYKATQVLDPTLLVGKEYWDEILNNSTYHVREEYALVYNLHSDSNMHDNVYNDLKNSGLKIYSITTTFRKVLGRSIFCPSIQDFLWLYKNASCIYADSFHAIAFSIIFNIPFVVTLPKEYATRLESILRLFDLEDCMFENLKINGWAKERIDWTRVNNKLIVERKKSMDWLLHSLRY